MVSELARCGVREAVISPGSRSTPLALALWREPSIEARVIVDERSAGFFALGAAQATGRPTAVLCTSGTAAANLHPAVCEADESAVGLIVLTADRPPELRGIGAGQTIDQLKLYGSAVRWFCEVGTHDADDAGLLHFRSVACRAYWTAVGDPRPGPVHLNVPWRDPLGPEPRPGEVTASAPLALEGRPGGLPLTTVPPAPPVPAGALVEALAERVRESRRGLILAGRLPDASASAAIAELARATGFPILAEPTSQIRLGPHDRGLVVSAYEAVARSRPPELTPDFTLRFGELPTCKPLRQWLAELGDAAPRRRRPRPRLERAEPDRRRDGPRAARTACPRRRRRARGRRRRTSRGRAHGWKPIGALARRSPRSSRASPSPRSPGCRRRSGSSTPTASSSTRPRACRFATRRPSSRAATAEVLFLANRGANGIDGLVSSGIGAAAASGRPTIIVTGDLGLLHDLGGLAAVAEATAPVRIVVVANDGGGIFDFLPQASQLGEAEFEALLTTPRGLDPAKAASLFGLPHRRIESLAELGEALAAGTGLIEVPVDRTANVALHRRLAAAAQAAL